MQHTLLNRDGINIAWIRWTLAAILAGTAIHWEAGIEETTEVKVISWESTRAFDFYDWEQMNLEKNEDIMTDIAVMDRAGYQNAR